MRLTIPALHNLTTPMLWFEFLRHKTAITDTTCAITAVPTDTQNVDLYFISYRCFCVQKIVAG